MARQAADKSLAIGLSLRDDYSTTLKSAVESTRKAASEIAGTNDTVAAGEEKLAKALKTRMSATKAVELAIRDEAAAGKGLEKEINNLDREYEEILLKLRAYHKIGAEMPQALVAQANAARTSAAALRDQLGGSLTAVGNTSTIAMGKVTVGTNNASKAMVRLPEQFAKGAAALSLLGGAASQMGGGVAQAASKIAGLGSMVATGGAVGIAIAAVTASIGAATYAWDVFTTETRNAEAAQRSMATMLEAQNGRLRTHRERVEEAEKAIRNYGRAASDVAREDLEVLITNGQRTVAQTQEEITALNRQSSAWKARHPEYKQEIEAIKARLAVAKEALSLNERERAAMKEAEGIRGEEAYAEADKTAREKSEDAYKEKKKRQADLAQSEREFREKLIADGKKQDDKEIAARVAKANAIEASQRAYVEKLMGYDDERFEHEMANLQKAADKRYAIAEASVAKAAEAGHAIAAQLSAVVDGTITAQEAFDNLAKSAAMSIVDMVERSILAFAAQAAAAQLAAHAFLPFVGIVVGATAAATITGIIKAQLGKFAEGGEIQSGIARGKHPGFDDVVVTAHDGEGFLKREDVGLMREFIGSMRNGGGRQGGGLTLNPTINLMDAGSAKDRDNMILEFGKRMEVLQRRGLLNFGRA